MLSGEDDEASADQRCAVFSAPGGVVAGGDDSGGAVQDFVGEADGGGGFFLAFRVLLQVFNNKGFLKGVPFTVSFLVSCYLTYNTACPLNNIIKDKMLSLTIIYNFNVLFAA